MRTAALFALAILFPTFAYLSVGTAHAAALVNINTAGVALLDTLPGIGPSYAARIITYRTEHGPFARIEDIQKVSGIGSGTYAKIEPLITVGDTSVPDTSDSTASSTPSNTASTTETMSSSSSNNSPPEYLPIPTLRLITNGTRIVSSGADVPFTTAIYDGKGNRRDDAMVTYAFGDGMRKVGASVYHKYYNPGEYLAIVRATTADGGNAQKEITVVVKDASIKIASVSSRGITLANNDSRTLDLSLWRLSMGGQEFKIPEDTHILAGHTVLFPSQVIELPFSDSAFLLYPSGEVAAQFPATMKDLGGLSSAQPLPSMASYEQVQEVEPPAKSTIKPIISTKANIQAHEKAVSAPTAANELAAVGASDSPNATGVFHSPWTLGFLGIMALASAAFIFL